MKRFTTLCAIALLAAPLAASAQKASFKDPTGDDNGPGTYKYPTDAVYKPGSFDITGLEVKQKGEKVDIELSVNANLEDPWRMGSGFAVQMAFIYVDVDGINGSGSTKGLPGNNVEFNPKDAWERVIVLSPQGASRVKSEVDQKAAALKGNVVIPGRTKGTGRKIMATIDRATLPPGDLSKFGYQVVMQSNEGFPDKADLLTRKVNEYEGQHRFGGGNDGDCDPHVMDVLAGAGKGEKAEVEAQHLMLKHECEANGAAKKLAMLTMVRAQ